MTAENRHVPYKGWEMQLDKVRTLGRSAYLRGSPTCCSPPLPFVGHERVVCPYREGPDIEPYSTGGFPSTCEKGSCRKVSTGLLTKNAHLKRAMYKGIS